MKRLITAFIAFSIFVLFSLLNAQSAGDYQTKASGNWSDATIWEIYNGSAWQNIGAPPDGSQTITVLSTDSVFVNVPVSLSGTLVHQGIVEPADSLTITVVDGGIYQYDRDEGTMARCIWEEGSTFLMTGVTATAPEDRDQDYYNVTFNTPGLLSNLNMNLNNNTISGDIRVILM